MGVGRDRDDGEIQEFCQSPGVLAKPPGAGRGLMFDYKWRPQAGPPPSVKH
jgi:hypothetical protein